MFKVLLNCALCVTMLLGGNMEDKTIQQYLTLSNSSEVIIEGEYNDIKNLDELNNILNTMLVDSHPMPAFGVSLDSETKLAITNGVWLRLIYNNTIWVDGMNFDELLIQVNPEFSGFNIIRGNNGVYEGRCYYIDLNNNSMKTLYNYLILNYTDT